MIIAGYFAIFFGLMWAIWPKVLRWWLVGKASWTLYWLLLGYIYVPLADWLRPYGFRGWVALAIGLLILGLFLRKLVGELATKAPSVAFRAVGVLNLAAGIYLVFFKK